MKPSFPEEGENPSSFPSRQVPFWNKVVLILEHIAIVLAQSPHRAAETL